MSSFYRASITKYHNLYTALFWFCQAGTHRLHFPQSCTCLACLHVRSDPAYKLARFVNLQISPDVQNIHHSPVRGPVEIAAIGYKVCTRRSGGLDCYHSGHPDHETRELSAFEAHCDRVSLGTHAIVALCERVARQMTVNDGSVEGLGGPFHIGLRTAIHPRRELMNTVSPVTIPRRLMLRSINNLAGDSNAMG